MPVRTPRSEGAGTRTDVPLERPGGSTVTRASLAVVPPFRLDLTVALLQRLAYNPVEVFDAGRYLRVFETARGPVAWSVTQPPAAARLRVALHGACGDAKPWLRRLSRALGTQQDLSHFHARVRRFPEVAAMARASRGVKPPRFQSLHESFASVLLFQQVSLASAVAMLRRLVVGLTRGVEVEGLALHPFPSAEVIAACSELELCRFGMSGAKASALRSVCQAIASGALTEEELSTLSSDALHERLLSLGGVGPWSAALLMLRGFGRLDRSPPGDVAAERLLRRLGLAGIGKGAARRARRRARDALLPPIPRPPGAGGQGAVPGEPVAGSEASKWPDSGEFTPDTGRPRTSRGQALIGAARQRSPRTRERCAPGRLSGRVGSRRRSAEHRPYGRPPAGAPCAGRSSSPSAGPPASSASECVPMGALESRDAGSRGHRLPRNFRRMPAPTAARARDRTGVPAAPHATARRRSGQERWGDGGSRPALQSGSRPGFWCPRTTSWLAPQNESRAKVGSPARISGRRLRTGR